MKFIVPIKVEITPEDRTTLAKLVGTPHIDELQEFIELAVNEQISSATERAEIKANGGKPANNHG